MKLTAGIVGMVVLVLAVARAYLWIEWSWWWVFLPIWFPAGLVVVGYFITRIFMRAYNFITKKHFPEKYEQAKKRQEYFRRLKEWGE